MKRICTLLMVALAMLVTSCLRYDKDEGLHLVRTVQVSVSVDDLESVGTKSAVTAQDVSAENFNIWIYDANGLVYDGYFTDADNIKVDNLTVGTVYHVRAVANTGALVPPTTLDEADALAFDWDISGLNSSKGVPMTYKDSFTLSITSALDIHFRRAVAKYTFVIDQSGFTGTYTIRSLRLCNAPSKVLAFADSKIDGTTIAATDGDYATDADLTKLNQGLGVHFFIYENNQGEILSGNSDPWKKEFINYNTDKAAAASGCTYLEVTGDYVTTGITVEDLTYRIYLGKNSTTNFDVTRNTAYTVILAPQDAAALDEAFTSWKVERGTISDTRGLAFSPASVSVPSMGEASVTVVPTPSSLEYVLEAGENFTASGLTFEQTGNAVTIKSTSIVSAETQTKLVARTSDGSKSKDLPVTVLPPTVESVTVTPADGWTLAKGAEKGFTATAIFSAGDPADVTAYASWDGGEYLSLVGTPSAVATLKGTNQSGDNAATVTATYGGKSGISHGTVTAPTVTAITVVPESIDMEQGDSFTFNVRATYSDSTVNMLSEGLTWNSSDNAGLHSDGAGKFTANSLGDFTVTASYDALEASAQVSVTPKLLGIEVECDPEGDIVYGASKTVSVMARYSDPSFDKDVTASCSFTSSSNLTRNGSVFIGNGLGDAHIDISYEGKEADVDFKVNNAVKSISIVEEDGWTIPQGNAKTFTAKAQWLVGDDTDITSEAVWSCSANLTKDGSVKGKFTGTTVGEATVTATYEDKDDSSSGSVVAQLSKIDIEAAPSGDILYGGTKTVRVKATYSDETVAYVTADAEYSGYDQYLTKGAVTEDGMPFTGKKVGEVTLTVTYGGKDASLTFSITNAVATVAVTPADGWEIAIGEDKQFAASITMLDGTVQDVTSSATWSTTTTSTLTKKATAGLFNAKAAGSAVVKAEYDGKSATSTGTVREDVYSYRIVLSGSDVAVTKDMTATVTPTVMYYVTKNGVEDNGTDVTASAVLKSKDTGIATVSGTTVTGVAVGSTRLYAEYSNGSQTVSSDKAVGGSYIDVTVSDKSVEDYDYNEPIFELSYSDVGANGSAATPTLTYSQTATRIWSDGSTDENVVMAAAGSAIPSGVTVTWGGSAKNSSGGSIDTGNGNVTAKNRGTDDYSRGIVFTATASAIINGKPGSISKDVYQVKNEVVSTVQADSKTENSDWSVGTYQETGFSNVSSDGGTASFETYVYHTATVYKKYTRTWSSGSSATSDWEYVSQSKAYDDVTISSNQSWARVNRSSAGGAFEAVAITVDPNGSAARTATITIRNSNGNTTTRTISQLAGLYIESYGTPTVTLSYPNTSIAYTRKSPLSPTLTVTQVYNYSDGSSPVVTLSSSDYTVSYSGSASGFSLDASSGVITPQSNAGVTTPGSTTYGEIENLSFSYDNIPVGGGSSSPNITYSQKKTETTDGRTSTSKRSITVTATVTVKGNGKTGSDSETVEQKGDPGQESTTTTTTITSGATIKYSKVAGGSSELSLGSNGAVSAGSNAGNGGGVSYGDVTVSFTAPKTTLSYLGETITCNAPTYSQTKTTAARSSTGSRSASVKANVELNGKKADKTAACTQDGDPGAAASSETITNGGTVTYGFVGTFKGFTHPSDLKIKADSNNGGSFTEYEVPVISNFSYSDAPADGGKSAYSLSFTQNKTSGRKATDSRSCTYMATVRMKDNKEGSASITFTQEGDPGESETTPISSPTHTLTFTEVTTNSAAKLITNTYTSGYNKGDVKWNANSNTSERSISVQVEVKANSKTATATAVSRQDAGAPIIMNTETDTETETRNNEWDGEHWVKINDKTSDSKTVEASSGSVTVTATAGYTHHVQPQKRTRTRNKYTWSDGSVTYGDWGDWSSWSNNGSATTSSKSGTPTLSSNADWLNTSGSYDANMTTSDRSAIIMASYGEVSATLTVTQGKNYITKTTQRTETEQADPSITNTEHWVKINGKTSDSKEVSADAGSVTVTVTAGHTHTVQPRIKTRTYDEYTWAVGPNTTGNYSEWTEENHGDPTVTHPSNDTPDLTSSASWLQTDGSYSANGSTESTRSATITATNNGASATLKVTQAKADSYSIEIK